MRTVLAAALAASLLLGGCGTDEPPLRLRAENGRHLVYDAHRVDDWPDPEFGYGGALDTQVRFRLSTIDAVPDRGGRYRVVVEAVRVAAPDRFGVTIDTETPDAEPGDDLGVEALARGLLRRHAEITIADHGLSAGVEPDRELREALRAWGDGQADPRRARPVMMLLDELLDGPRVAAKWLQSATLLLPRDPRPAEDATWTRRAPPSPSPAGSLGCELTVRIAAVEGDVVVLRGEGDFEVAEALEKPSLLFESGTLVAETRFDRARGIVTGYEETTEFAFRKIDDGAETRATWTRTLTLVE